MSKIVSLIADSRFSIHDISRVELDPGTELPRFNMPIELGIAIGAKHLGRKKLRDHCILVLDGAETKNRYRYQKFASDLAGLDIKTHANNVAQAISAVRDFLAPHSSEPLPGARAIERALADFKRALPELARAAGQDTDELQFVDLLRHVAAYLVRTA